MIEEKNNAGNIFLTDNYETFLSIHKGKEGMGLYFKSQENDGKDMYMLLSMIALDAKREKNEQLLYKLTLISHAINSALEIKTE